MSEIPPQFTSYPRADSGGSSGSGAPIRPPGVYFKTIGEAWQIIQQDMATWILGGLIAGGIYLVTFLVFYALAFPLFKDVLLADQQSLDWQQLLKREGVSMLISLVPSGLFVTFMGGMYDMAIQRLDGYPFKRRMSSARWRNFHSSWGPTNSNAQNIYTYGGNGVNAFGGDGGQAPSIGVR